MRVILKQPYKESQLALFAVDKAHCLLRNGRKEERNHSNVRRCLWTGLTSLYFVVLLLSFYLLTEASTFVTKPIYKSQRFPGQAPTGPTPTTLQPSSPPTTDGTTCLVVGASCTKHLSCCCGNCHGKRCKPKCV